MIRIVFFHIFLIFPIVLNAQINNIAISQKLSMHSAVSDNSIDAIAILSNQAAALSIDGLNYGMLAEKKYLTNELNQMIFFISKKYSKNGVTIIQDYNGFSESYCMQTSFGFTKYISDNTSLGLRFNYLFRHIKGNQNSKFIGSEISLKKQLSKYVKTGLVIINPQSVFSKENNSFNETNFYFKWGFLYDVSKQFYLFLDLMKPERGQLGLVGGCTYSFNKKVDAMYSFSFQEMSNRLSLGFNIKKMKIKLMNSFHPQLGYSPSIMLLSNLNNKIIIN